MDRPPLRGQPAAKGEHPKPLDDIDRQIVTLLIRNGRMSNAALAAATSTAESTTHKRLQTLRESGVISGIHAEVNTAAVGRPLQALIFVRIHPSCREELHPQARRLAKLPSVLDVFFMAGHYDFIVWVAVADPSALRDFVINDLSSHKELAATETSVILDHWRGEEFEPLP